MLVQRAMEKATRSRVIRFCTAANMKTTVPLTVVKEDMDEVAKIQLIRYLPSCKDETLTCGEVSKDGVKLASARDLKMTLASHWETLVHNLEETILSAVNNVLSTGTQS